MIGQLMSGYKKLNVSESLVVGYIIFLMYSFWNFYFLFWSPSGTDLFFVLFCFFSQSKAKAEKNQAMEHAMSENSCQLCAVEKLTFEPPPMYCTPCGARIKRNSMYYTMGAGDTRHYFCIPCYNEARGDTIIVDGTAIPKARLEKKKNDEETEEWVCVICWNFSCSFSIFLVLYDSSRQSFLCFSILIIITVGPM